MRALALPITARLLAGLAVALSPAPALSQVVPEPSSASYAAVLTRYTEDGEVRYALLQSEDPGEWRRWLATLEAARPDTLSIEAQRAFWINAYNSRVIAGVLRRYPLDSVRDVGFLGGRVRGFFGRREHPVAGARRTLDEIEKEILMADPLWDPRIHFALNCASLSCPPLRPEPYEASRLDTQLDFQTRAFLNGPDGHRLDPSRKVLRVSRILDWYREDFERAGGSVRGYLSKYLTGEASAAAQDPSWKIEYMDYDWGLNDAGIP
jgi:hypothetical protein